ncbi:MAG: hypothetical protein HQK99_17340 [Nitrospirae bacterium]|nr:hypothetical protein [Nitrospirota bacterium]
MGKTLLYQSFVNCFEYGKVSRPERFPYGLLIEMDVIKPLAFSIYRRASPSVCVGLGKLILDIGSFYGECQGCGVTAKMVICSLPGP